VYVCVCDISTVQGWGVMDETLLDALVHNKEEFVRLFFEKRLLNLKAFFKLTSLCELYDKVSFS